MTTKTTADASPGLAGALASVRRFLQEALPDVRRVEVSRAGRVESGPGAWEAEAVVWQPNATVQALGLPTRRPVLDANTYLVRLDEQLEVIGYENIGAGEIS